jgi:basic amino acid/polyamine antiporter, APA family
MNSSQAPQELRRELSLLDATMINVGSMIGSGIFLVPAVVALYCQSSWLVLAVWTVGGLVSLFGALSVAELGAIYPKAGGQYVYLSELYGPFWGFLYGWTAFTVIMPGSISAVAVGFATYLAYFLQLSPIGIKIVAIASILALSFINILGVKLGALVQNLFTFSKMGLLGLLIVVGLWHGSAANLSAGRALLPNLDFAGALGLALIAVLWAYDGWIEITYVGGEVKNPGKNIPWAVIVSMLIVIGLYVSVNAAYLLLLPFNSVAHSDLVAADAGRVILGAAGATVAVIGVIIATVGSNNGFVLTGARIYYAMAKEKAFFASLADVHPRFRTPAVSLTAQGIWASLLVLTGTFEELFTYVVFVSWIFYALTAAGVFVSRNRFPELIRPYRTWGYPWTLILFIAFSVYLVANTLIESPRESFIGIVIVLVGVPAYWYWARKASKPHADGPAGD